MKKSNNKNFLRKSERGQAIILIVFAFIGLVAAVGLVTDTGLLMIEYGKLKRSVDAAAVAAAQEFRPDPDTGDLNTTAMENAATGMLQINQIQNVSSIEVHTCEETGAGRPKLCNPHPDTDPINNRKLVEVTAVADVTFAFLRVIGINSASITASAIGEAASIDLVLLIDTSGGMAYQTTGSLTSPDPGDDPRVCNTADNCQPLRAVKDVAMDFVDSLIYFGYDRVAVIAMTGQAGDASTVASRDPEEVIPLSFDANTIMNAIDTLKVFQPRVCAGANGTHDFDPEECLRIISGTYEKPICPLYENQFIVDTSIGRNAQTPEEINPSSCTSSNIGGVLSLAQDSFSGSGNSANQRADSLWVTVLLASGPANSSTPSDADKADYPYGYCPQNTWFIGHPSYSGSKWCRDKTPGNERSASSALVSFTNPYDSTQTIDISLYDAEDYARDMADNLAAMKSGNGVTIYTIGLGESISNMPTGWTGAVPCSMADQRPAKPDCGEAEYLLTYIAREAGSDLNAEINHGEYFYAPNNVTLRNIFEIIAQNIATKISE